MKRLTFTILLFLLLGAVVNVAVAWVFAVTLVFPHGGTPDCAAVLVDRETKSEWLVCLNQRLGAAQVTDLRAMPSASFDRSSGTKPDELVPEWAASLIGPIPSNEAVRRGPWRVEYRLVTARGWPLLALRAGCAAEYSRAGVEAVRFDSARVISDTRVEGDWVPPDARMLPLELVFPGFLINTLFYAAILWLLIPGPFVLRRFIRRKRGRCPKCGYDLRGSPDTGCPECGWGREDALVQERSVGTNAGSG